MSAEAEQAKTTTSAQMSDERRLAAAPQNNGQEIETRASSTSEQRQEELSIISQPIVITAAPTTNGETQTTPPIAANSPQWVLIAQATRQEVRERMSLASDQLGYSLRQLYASASSVSADLPPSYHNIPGIVPYFHGRSSGPPPSYEEVVNPYAAPPTYQSLFGQMLEARKKSRGLLDLLRRLLIVSTLGCTMLIALMILVPFTMIIVGAVYMDQCRVEHIPAFLLVGGFVWASKNIVHCYVQCQAPPNPLADFNDLESATATVSVGQQQAAPQSPAHSESDGSEQRESASPRPASRQQTRRRLKSAICESLLNCILFGWFIAGCVIVFRNYEPDFENTTSERYCNRTVYMYTFWLISSAMLMFGLFVGCICCLMVSSAIASRHEDLA